MAELPNWPPIANGRLDPSLVCFLDILHSTWGGTGARAAIVGSRVRIPRTGTLVDLYCFPANQSGNIEAGVASVEAPTRRRLWTSGLIACPAAGAWRKLGDPNIQVNEGQLVDLYLGADNGVATFLLTGSPSLAASPLPASFLSADAGGARALWLWQATAPPAPAAWKDDGTDAFAMGPTAAKSAALIARIA